MKPTIEERASRLESILIQDLQIMTASNMTTIKIFPIYTFAKRILSSVGDFEKNHLWQLVWYELKYIDLCRRYEFKTNFEKK